jgi:extracellular elastinolytic metalloproteinase
MGEGWGDFFATILRTTAESTREDDFGMGVYSAGKGIRKFFYSTKLGVNPSTYAYIRKPGYWGVHAKGEVWAAILYEVFWNLVDKNGWEPDWFNVNTTLLEVPESSNFHSGSIQGDKKKPKSPKAPKAGNKLALRLVMDGLKLQPCYPSFVDARDAILLADQVATKGNNQCEIWKGFAKRGLGVDARSGGKEDFGLPDECVE